MCAILLVTLLSCQLAPVPADPGTSEKAQFVKKIQDQLAVLDLEINRLRQEADQAAGSSEEPELLLQLAGKLREQSRLRYTLKAELEPGSRPYDAPEVKQSLEAALETLGRLTSPATPAVRAKAMLEVVEVLRELGRYDQMLRYIVQLTEALPRSPEAGWAQLILGNYYFDKEDLEPAARYYRKILAGTYQPDTADLARYRLGWVLINQAGKGGRKAWEEALGLFEQLARSHRNKPPIIQNRVPQDLRYDALTALVFCYTETRSDSQALSYFSRFDLSREESLSILAKLANRYFIKERYASARPLYQKLLSLSPEAEEAEDYRARLKDIEQLLKRK